MAKGVHTNEHLRRGALALGTDHLIMTAAAIFMGPRSLYELLKRIDETDFRVMPTSIVSEHEMRSGLRKIVESLMKSADDCSSMSISPHTKRDEKLADARRNRDRATMHSKQERVSKLEAEASKLSGVERKVIMRSMRAYTSEIRRLERKIAADKYDFINCGHADFDLGLLQDVRKALWSRECVLHSYRTRPVNDCYGVVEAKHGMAIVMPVLLHRDK